LEATSDAVIALAYFITPFSLVVLVRNRKDLPFNWIFLMFGAFILSCGLTHLVNTFGPWVHPSHSPVLQRSLWFTLLSGVIKLFTAIISLITAIASVALVPLAIRLPSPSQLGKALRERKIAEAKLQKQLERSLLISNITNKIRNSFHTQDIFQIAAVQIGSVMRASRCTIHRYIRNSSQERAKIPCEAEYLHPNFPSEPFIKVDMPISGFLTTVLANDEAVQVDLEDLYPQEASEKILIATLLRYDVRQVLCVRSSYQGVPNGIIMLHQCGEMRWAPEDLRFIEELAAQLGIALQQTHLLEQERKRHILELKNIKLEKARDLAEKENTAKSEFLLMMSHEVRTPMNAIVGMNTLLQKSNLTPEQEDCVQIIEDSSNLLLGIINSFLDFSKLESGKLKFDNRPFDLHHILDTSVNMFAVNAKKEKDVDVILKLSPNVPRMVKGDKFRLQQIVINLLSNGVKFTEAKGSVTIEVQLLGQNSKQTELQFSVTDTGIGIPEIQLERLFQPFSQVHSSGMSRKYGGTGLGLTICKKLCELMGGSVWVSTKVGVGSTFYFTAKFGSVVSSDVAGVESPRTERILESTSPEAEVSLLGTPNYKTRILLAEDNFINQRVAVSLMHKIGYDHIDLVSNGSQAVQAIINENVNKWGIQGADPYTVILMDLQMPEMDGIEAAEEIRKLTAGHNGLPFIIALTANIQPEIQIKCKEVGFNDFLAKPFKLEQLQRMMHKFTTNHENVPKIASDN
jgi:signal transduction histidine kinase/CheY-like chemotaxis protein